MQIYDTAHVNVYTHAHTHAHSHTYMSSTAHVYVYTVSLSNARSLTLSPSLSHSLSYTHSLSHERHSTRICTHTHTLPRTHTHNVWNISSTGIQLYTKRLSVDIPTCCSCCYNPAAIWRSRIGKEPQACKKKKYVIIRLR